MITLKILIVIPYFYPAEFFGGPVKVAFDTGKELVKRGHEVVVYTSDAKDLSNRIAFDKAKLENIEIRYFKNCSMSFVKNSKLFITPQLLTESRLNLKSFDIIHLHEYTTFQNIVMHKFAMKYGVPYIIQAHGSLPKNGRYARKWIFDMLFGSKILNDASRVIALTQTEVDHYLHYGVSSEQIDIIPNGLNSSAYSNLPPKGFFKKQYNVPNEAKIILYLGRIHKTKGLNLLVIAFARLRKMLPLENLYLVIAGPNDGYLSEIMSLIFSLGLSNSVVITGFLDQNLKLAALVDADLFVTPSFNGFPMTFLESCIVGTPILTTNLGDKLDWIDGIVGRITSSDTSDMSDAMSRIISNSPLREQFSKNCINLVNSDFTLGVMVDKLELSYSKAIEHAAKKIAKPIVT